MRYSIVLSLFVALASGACTEQPTLPGETGDGADEIQEPPVNSGQAISFVVIDEVHNTIISGIRDRRRTVIRSESEWEEFWNDFTASVEPKPEPPAIDFTERMVLVAAMGQRSTGGYAIAIDEVTEDNGVLSVRVTETVPASSCLLTQVITAPVTAVTVPRRDGSVEFNDVTATLDC